MSTFSKRQFLNGAMSLTLSTALVKVVGLIYKIPLMRYLSAVGMGYFNSAYELYTLFFVISTAGIPIAISILISRNTAIGRYKNAELVYKRALRLLFLIGILGFLAMCFGSHALSKAINNPGCAYALVLVSPTVFFVSISGAVRGYFQGYRNMVPTAISQLAEALGKLLLGLLLAAIAIRNGLGTEKAAAMAILGVTLGTALSTLYLCAMKARFKTPIECAALENSTEPLSKTVKMLLGLALPITVSSVLVSMNRIIDMVCMLNRISGEGRIALYGGYSTMALPIYNLPSALVAGVAVSLVPAISNLKGSGDKEREEQILSSAFRLCAMIAFPVAVGIGVYPEEILGLLFGGEESSVAISSPLLACLSLSVFLSCLVLVTNSMLQAKGKTLVPIASMISGLAVKALFAYLLIGQESIGALGAPISTLLCNLVTLLINMKYMDSCFACRSVLGGSSLKPLVCAMIAALASLMPFSAAIKLGASESVAFVAAALFCAAVYGISLLLCGAVDGDFTKCFTKRRINII